MDKAEQRTVIARHVQEIEKIYQAYADRPDSDPIKTRMAARLEEAREAARKVEANG